MPISKNHILFLSCSLILSGFWACREEPKPPATEIVTVPEKLDEKVRDHIRQSIRYTLSHQGDLDTNFLLALPELVDRFYNENNYEARWSRKDQWLPRGDSLFQIISQAHYLGLYPENYHFQQVAAIRNQLLDSLSRRDAALWARADLLLTDGATRLLKDLKLGRLPADSISQFPDTLYNEEFFLQKLRAIGSGNPIRPVIHSLEPQHTGYRQIREALAGFLAAAKLNDSTVIPYPSRDTALVRRSLVTRFRELGMIDSSAQDPDSLALAGLLKKYQQENGLDADGKLGPQTARSLNLTDRQKFARVAVTLDRYKKLPEQMPERYIWVNIPSYNLKLVERDTVKLESRVVVGKPNTRTPVLNSSIYEMITYPQWTIPQSIIVKEILPALKKDPGYLASKGYSLVRDTGVVDPYTVDWSIYKKGIPFRVVQGSGDDNALGIMKFNFSNKYAVYLHDTNQRYYFSKPSRALSHGCVRVQEWEKIAFYMLKNDSVLARQKKTNSYTRTDSVRKWLAVKEKRAVPVRNRMPVYIRYFSCDASKGSLVFYEDIYGEDQQLIDLYYSK